MNRPVADNRHAAPRRTRSRRLRGFTLIEVLAALVIVALGMLGVIQAVTQHARNGAYLREKTLAHWVAMNIITEQRLQPSPPDVRETSDELEFANTRWRWTLRVSETPVESLRRMDVSVRHADAADNDVLASVTGFYGTAIGAAGGSSLDWNGTTQQGGQGGEEEQEEGQQEGDGSSQPQEPPVTPPPETDPEDVE
jgi:general secretion pathway protein I